MACNRSFPPSAQICLATISSADWARREQEKSVSNRAANKVVRVGVMLLDLSVKMRSDRSSKIINGFAKDIIL